MQTFWRLVFIGLLSFCLFHLIRDVAQILDSNTFLTSVGHIEHQWCQPVCEYVTLPLDVLGIIGPLAVLRRKRIGLLGLVVLGTIPLWLLAQLLP